MTPWWLTALLLMSSTPSAMQTAGLAALPNDPSVFIQKLYSNVVLFRPLGILDYEYTGSPKRKIIDGPRVRKRFMPYLSETLRHQIILNDACWQDWRRQNPDPNLKGPDYEGGIFAGELEFGDAESFHLEGIQGKPDGTLHATVRLSGPIDPPKWSSWRVEIVLIRQADGLRVDDVIYLHDTPPTRLSGILSSGCKGSSWIGN